MYTCAPWWSDFLVISGKHLYHKMGPMTTFPSYFRSDGGSGEWEKKRGGAAAPLLAMLAMLTNEVSATRKRLDLAPLWRSERAG